MECIHCGNKFTSLSILNNHVKNAKYCLKKRGIKKTAFNCKKCSKSFTSKRWCISHEVKCGESIENLQKHIEKLQI